MLSNTPIMISSIMMSFAGGSFVYIACSEILIHEFSKAGYKLWKCISFTIGSGVIIGLLFLHGH